MSEIRIRVKPNVKEMLETNKEKYGFSINFQVNFAIFKYLILDSRTPYWKLDTRPDPHYEDINKMPDEVKDINNEEFSEIIKDLEDKFEPEIWAKNNEPNIWNGKHLEMQKNGYLKMVEDDSKPRGEK